MTATLLIHNQFRLNLPERQLSSSLFFFLRLDSGVDGLAQNWWDRCGCVIPWRPILFEFATWLEKFLNLLCLTGLSNHQRQEVWLIRGVCVTDQ